VDLTHKSIVFSLTNG